MQDENERPRVLDYGLPPRGPGFSAKIDGTVAVALVVGFLSMVTVWTPDRGGMRYQLQVVAGTWGGAIGMIMAVISVCRLLLRRKGRALDIITALAAFVCAAMAEIGGIKLIMR